MSDILIELGGLANLFCSGLYNIVADHQIPCQMLQFENVSNEHH